MGATNLSSIVNSTNNPIEQAFILSKVIQYLKTAKDFGNGRMETWNDNVESYIAKDKKRRNKFDTLFGFSLTDEANAYYKELEKGKGKIGTHSEIGLGFDAAASVKSTDTATTSFGTGVDVFKGDLDMLAVDEKPVLIEIKDQEKITKLTKMV
ncbi:MAG: hypothetical protein H6767_07045 [Candidatus Peribacteria bacterium]|nr:MAG: hypothetical protein H6767_07045 [Candidatus Peribacteria bacterium]